MLELKNNILYVTLPEGKTQEELIKECKRKIRKIEKDLYGKEIKINGRITTGMALFLGHKLAHLCKSISIFDPKENKYINAVWH